MNIEYCEKKTMTIKKTLSGLFLSALFALVALFVEFLGAALLNFMGFGWPLHLFLDPGANLYAYLVAHGFYPYSGKLLIDLDFAVKFDLVLDFLFFAWLFFSFPDLPKKWISLKINPGKFERTPSWMK